MTIADALDTARISRADAEVLLGWMLGIDRARIFAHPEKNLSSGEEGRWRAFVARRETGEPVAYITRTREFYGRNFRVDRRALIPRPSTEGLLEVFLRVFRERVWKTQKTQRTQKKMIDPGIVAFIEVYRSMSDVRTLVDVGTGSGCIAVTLALELPDVRIIATDTSADALNLARENAARHDVANRIEFLEGSLLEPLMYQRELFFIVSNPPYIPTTRILERGVAHFEPPEALFAGSQGLDVLLPLVEAARNDTHCSGIALECEEAQIQALDGKNTRQ